MKRIIKIIFFIFLGGFIVIQFFQPKKNLTETSDNHLFSEGGIPEDIKLILKNSCTDCHSNQTNYLWYHNIAPVSMLVNGHILEGKKELNLSEWKTTEDEDKIAMLVGICEEVKKGKMPIKQYTMIHQSAKLSKEQIDKICAWSEKYAEEILAKMEGTDSLTIQN